jgi:hypothetical protein
LAELPGYELLREWQAAVSSWASAAGGSSEVPRRLLAPMERQIELIQEAFERERRLQQELLQRAFAPIDAVFDLLEQSGAALRSQAQALRESAGALEQAAAMTESQAELFEQAISVLRKPGEIVKRTAGLPREDEVE